MLVATLFMLGLGAAAAAGLAVASKLFQVDEDPRIEQVLDALPGANCGGCGFAGCAAMAEAIAKGIASPESCVAGGPETAALVGRALGIKVEFKEPRIAEPLCRGGDRAEERFRYSGALDCKAAFELAGGPLACSQGCLGYGSCIRACPFDAIRMGSQGLPVVYPQLCKGCGMCASACPTGVIRLKTLSGRLLHLNTTDECLAPCRTECPAQIDIPAYIEASMEGRFDDALRIIKERNPFPCTCGRVCPAPCESVCRRKEINDDPVFHNAIKRFVADREMNSGKRLALEVLPDTGRKVAVIGGGPAGLSCAYFLRRLGHDVTVFEAMEKLGGMLRYGIPEYRLPKKILDYEIRGILDLGVRAETNKRFGKDFDIEDLDEQGFEAVFLSTGAWVNTSLRCQGEDMEGVYSGIGFLAKVAQGQAPKLGSRVVVIGGGNTAIDSARTALRLGCTEVTIMYRRSREEMPANPEEIEAAEEEGVRFLFLAAPRKFVGKGGKVTAVEYIRMELGEPDESGRRKPVPIPGSDHVLEVDSAIAAIGQRPTLDAVTEKLREMGVILEKWGAPSADPLTCRTGADKVFVGGDQRTGPGLVVEAIGDGRRAARAIHLFLMGEPIEPPRTAVNCRTSPVIDPAELMDVAPSNRIQPLEVEVSKRLEGFEEVILTISEDELIHEASRCLRCGRLCFDKEDSA